MGKIVADLVMVLALGGDCLADVAVLRAQLELCGLVASDPVVSRLVSTLAAEGPRALKAIRKARAAARERRGRWPGTPDRTLPVSTLRRPGWRWPSTDSGGGTHEFLTWLAGRRPHYSIGMTITEDMQQAILTLSLAT